MSGEPVWIKADTIAEALTAMRRDVSRPAEHLSPLLLVDLGDDVANETMTALRTLVGGLPGSLARHADGLAAEVTNAGARVVEADLRGGK